jgi:thiamine-phosphate pyrophosphorylase
VIEIAPRVVVVTDRSLCGERELIARIEAIVGAAPRGSVIVQVREKDLDGGALYALTRVILAIARPAGAPVWVNDRVDIALVAAADGVQLPERGLAIADARALAPGVAIGSSRHSIAGVRDAIGADLVVLGPIWDTPSKRGVITPLGSDALAAARAVLPPDARLVAIGGIDGPDRARDAARAGADAIAVVRAAWTSRDPGETIAALVEIVEASGNFAAAREKLGP